MDLSAGSLLDGFHDTVFGFIDELEPCVVECCHELLWETGAEFVFVAHVGDAFVAEAVFV